MWSPLKDRGERIRNFRWDENGRVQFRPGICSHDHLCYYCGQEWTDESPTNASATSENETEPEESKHAERREKEMAGFGQHDSNTCTRISPTRSVHHFHVRHTLHLHLHQPDYCFKLLNRGGPWLFALLIARWMIACFYISRFRRLTVAMGSARFHLASSLIQHNISTTLFLLFWPSWLIVLTRVFIRRQSYPIMNVPTKGDGEHIFHYTILVQYSMLLDALGIRYTHCTLSSNVRSKISRS